MIVRDICAGYMLPTGDFGFGLAAAGLAAAGLAAAPCNAR